jgi:hypothetical protein
MVGGKIVRTSFFHGKPSHHYVIIIIIIIIMFSVQGRLEQLAILVVRARHEQPALTFLEDLFGLVALDFDRGRVEFTVFF